MPIDVAMDMVVHRFNDRIRDDLARIGTGQARRARQEQGARSERVAADRTPAPGDRRQPVCHRLIRTPDAPSFHPRRLSVAICLSAIVTNDELARTVDTSDEWIRDAPASASGTSLPRTKPRLHGHRRGPRRAGRCRRRRADDVDAIILATSTPDQAFPATALRVQAAAGREAGLRLRSVRRLCRVHLWAVRRRRNDQVPPGARHAGHRQRGLLPHPELAGPRHLRAVRRRRRRRVPARRATMATTSDRASCRPISMPRARSATFCMSMAPSASRTSRATW